MAELLVDWLTVGSWDRDVSTQENVLFADHAVMRTCCFCVVIRVGYFERSFRWSAFTCAHLDALRACLFPLLLFEAT